ncbi:MAG: putative Kinesin-II 95 kDa subunit [Streblomastix strix]|uniref:Putative Kinesin-II 95 kDa subunit n=1 Tax=Streblomastix strix TaxID=222440 RepID=A0A5J4VAP0_9EUKA|nr:MAG: putative Kinesin-II 95 kDa subunit [Streblomastix strix]
MTEGDNVRVAVRCRPMSSEEILTSCKPCVHANEKTKTVRFSRSQSQHSADHTFMFDNVYDQYSIQSKIYEESCKTIVDGVMRGFNGTIYAYGQTGTGKTYTMEGTKDQPGIIPLSFEHIFSSISSENSHKRQRRQQNLD